ncbi:hypothetical protein CRUP_002388 [Coryphaenoides rupestris]|nr:hypothetical protein CRUP_002388 [Coryphaenoides rupestris]
MREEGEGSSPGFRTEISGPGFSEQRSRVQGSQNRDLGSRVFRPETSGRGFSDQRPRVQGSQNRDLGSRVLRTETSGPGFSEQRPRVQGFQTRDLGSRVLRPETSGPGFSEQRPRVQGSQNRDLGSRVFRPETSGPGFSEQRPRVQGSQNRDLGSRVFRDQRPRVQDDPADPYPEQYDDVMDFIEATIGRLRRSSETGAEMRARRERQARERGGANTGGGGGGGGGGGHRDKRKGRGRGGSRGGKAKAKAAVKDGISVQTRGCLLREVHLNVTDLGLGYRTKEEMIFRYCSGPCAEAETNYDKILNNLTHNKKLDRGEAPSRTCCRPVAFDDDLSFLDDDVVYHTLKKHSARRCACV